MIIHTSKQTGSAHVVIIVTIVVALVGALGFAFWKNFMQPSGIQASQEQPEKTSQPKKAEPVCTGDFVEEDGVFCSESVGVEFKIPDLFVDKFKKGKNYEVYKGPMESAEGTLTGKSLEYYEAIVASGEEHLSLTVAKEPLRSGYSSIGHALQRTYFNATNGNLYLVNAPPYDYDSTTGVTTYKGKWTAGEPVPFFEVGKTKVYQGKVGDAGTMENGYLMVVNDHLVIIKVRHVANPMNEPMFDAEQTFTDLNSNLKQIKVLK